MPLGQAVTAFVEVPLRLKAFEALKSIDAGRHVQPQFPAAITFPQAEGFAAQRRASPDEFIALRRQEFPFASIGAATEINLTDAVALKIVIDAVRTRREEEFHTGILPNLLPVSLAGGEYSLFCNHKVKVQLRTAMRHFHSYLRFIRKQVRPV